MSTLTTTAAATTPRRRANVAPRATWSATLARYSEAATRIGHSPRSNSQDAEERWAGRWAASYRARHAGTAPAPLDPGQIEALQSAPFWYWTSGRNDRWNVQFVALVAFLARTGRYPNDTEDHSLYTWVTKNRYLANLDQLDPLRRSMLSFVPGFFPPSAEPEDWAAGLNNYRVVAASLGRSPNQQSDNVQERDAARWARTQRARLGNKQLRLTAEQIAALEASPYWFWPTRHQDTWDTRYRELDDFVARHHRFPRIASQDPAEIRVAKWVAFMSDVHKGQRPTALTPERAELLDRIPGWQEARGVAPAEKDVKARNAQRAARAKAKRAALAQWG